MREYRVGERVALGSDLVRITKLNKRRAEYQSEPNGIGAGYAPLYNLPRWEFEAIGRLMAELATGDCSFLYESATDGGVSLHYNLYSNGVKAGPTKSYIVTGDNIGHALWLLRKKVRQAGKL